jgi:hypothetical protein
MFAVPSGSIVRDWTFVSHRTIGNTNGFRDAITSFARTVMRDTRSGRRNCWRATWEHWQPLNRWPVPTPHVAVALAHSFPRGAWPVGGTAHDQPQNSQEHQIAGWLVRRSHPLFGKTMWEVLVGDITARTTGSGTPFKAISLGPSVSVRTRQRQKPALRWTSVVQTFRYHCASRCRMNRTIYFPAFVLLLLFALLLLFSEQFSRFSAPRSMRESGKAIDREALEKGTLMNPPAVTRRDLQSDLAPVLSELGRHLSFVGLFAHPVKINVPANEERVSFVDATLNKITRKLRGGQIHQKNHVHSPFNLKIVSRYRPAVNLVTRIDSRPVAFYQLGLARKIGAFVPYRQSIGGAGPFVQKDARATQTNGRSWKKIRSDSRRLERQLARFFRSMWRRDRYALGP